MAKVDLQPGAKRSQRGAQFVGGVGDEPALSVGGGVDPREEVVERRGQAGEFVAGGWDVEAAVQIGARDRGGLAADGVHGSQRSAQEPPADHAEQHDDGGHPRRQGGRQFGGRGGQWGCGGTDVDGDRARRGGDLLRGDAEGRAVHRGRGGRSGDGRGSGSGS